jgi:hypothetical protein
MPTRIIAVVVVCFGACCAGCGPSPPVVKGKVTYKNSPVTSGEVRFVSAASGVSRSGLIAPDGSYEVRDAPLGEVKIAVVSYKSSGAAAKPTIGEKRIDSSTPGLRPALPTKYASAASSGLVYTVTPGGQSFDIELKD